MDKDMKTIVRACDKGCMSVAAVKAIGRHRDIIDRTMAYLGQPVGPVADPPDRKGLRIAASWLLSN